MEVQERGKILEFLRRGRAFKKRCTQPEHRMVGKKVQIRFNSVHLYNLVCFHYTWTYVHLWI